MYMKWLVVKYVQKESFTKQLLCLVVIVLRQQCKYINRCCILALVVVSDTHSLSRVTDCCFCTNGFPIEHIVPGKLLLLFCPRHSHFGLLSSSPHFSPPSRAQALLTLCDGVLCPCLRSSPPSSSTVTRGACVSPFSCLSFVPPCLPPFLLPGSQPSPLPPPPPSLGASL